MSATVGVWIVVGLVVLAVYTVGRFVMDQRSYCPDCEANNWGEWPECLYCRRCGATRSKAQ